MTTLLLLATNIILFIGDGMSTPQRMTGEEFSRKLGNGPLIMNSFPCQATTRTYSASSLVTDSAASATAIACGEKTYNGAVGVDKDGQRLTSCAEVAHQAGAKVGIVTSVTINHATPSGFYAHQPNRGCLKEIGFDLPKSGFDLFLGGGLEGGFPEVYQAAADAGYTVFDLENSQPLHLYMAKNKLWGHYRNEALPYAINKGTEPRLPELTKFALSYLSNSTSTSPSFFLMVEGGRIDWAGHSNDAAANLRDLLELDDAIKVAVEFQKSHPDTLIIVTGDHETGGMTMGFAGTGYAFYMEKLAAQKCSADQLGNKINYNGTEEEMFATLKEWFGFGTPGLELTDSEKERLTRSFREHRLPDTCRRIMSEKSGVGWTSGSHTGLPALTPSIGPGSEKFTGLLNNTDISKCIKSFYLPR